MRLENKLNLLWLIELSDNELKLVTNGELDKIDKSDSNFDGFQSYRLVGRVFKNPQQLEEFVKEEHITKDNAIIQQAEDIHNSIK